MNRRPVDRLLLLFALLLMALGMVFIYSASAVKAFQVNPAGAAFLTRELVGGGVGIVLMLIATQAELGSLAQDWKPLKVWYGVMLLFLAVVFVFPKINGAHRWIKAGPMSFQPSEFFKPLAVLLAASWMARHQEKWRETKEALPGLFRLMLLLLPPLALILKQPDFGTTFLIVFVVMLVVFLGGAPRWIFAIAIPALATVGFLFVRFSPYRWLRVTSFLHPDADPLGTGHQALQSLVAVGNGGFAGVGLGQGMQKLFYLPEAHTDFIYAVIGEEAGLVGTVLVLALFVAILWRGFRIARRSQDGFLSLCAMGFTLLLVVQALMNMSVVLSLAPNKGIPLPFISYGPSSLMASLLILGLLLSVSKDAA